MSLESEVAALVAASTTLTTQIAGQKTVLDTKVADATASANTATAQAILADADRVQTGLDRAATAADRVQTTADRVSTTASAATATAQAGTATTQAGIASNAATTAANAASATAANAATALTAATTATAQAGIAAAKAGEANASAIASANSASEAAATLAGKLNANNPTYTGNFTGGTGVFNLGGQLIKDAAGNLTVTGAPMPVYGDTARFLSTGATSGVSFADAGSTAGYQTIGSSGNDMLFKIGSADRMRLDLAGNLGINAIPRSESNKTTLTLDHAWGGQIDVGSYGTSHAQFGSDVYGTGQHCRIQSASGIVFKPGLVEKMRLDAEGNLAVGTMAPSGRITAQNSGATTCFSAVNTDTADSTSYLFVGASTGQNRIVVFGSGNVNNYNNSYGGLSDQKLKENITDASPKLAKLMQVRIVNYNLKNDPDKTKLIGVVAQELEQISPGLVEESIDREAVTKTRTVEVPETPAVAAVLDDQGNIVTPAVEAVPATTFVEEYVEHEPTGTTTKSVKYSIFVPMLIKAMQEQQAQIESLAARVAALESA